jgi:ATP-dependent DNA helicase 2 subunit 2
VESEPTEYMPIEETYSPVYHRINQAIRRRATHPEETLAEPAEILTKFSKPPPDLVSKAAHQLKALIEAADLKKGKLFRSF